MLKKIFLLQFFCIASTGMFATDALIEGTAAYYYPTSHLFRDIYSESGLYGLEVSVQAWRGLYVWVNGNAFSKSGHTSGTDSFSRIRFVPLGTGLKYLWEVKFVDFYLGAGVLPTYLNIHDHSDYVVPKIAKWGCGGIAKAGVIFNLPLSFIVDVFTNYSYIKIPNHDTRGGTVTTHSANLSGFSFGGGLGYRIKPRSERRELPKHKRSPRKATYSRGCKT